MQVIPDWIISWTEHDGTPIRHRVNSDDLEAICRTLRNNQIKRYVVEENDVFTPKPQNITNTGFLTTYEERQKLK